MNILQQQAEYRNSKPSMLGRGIERLTHPFGKALASVVPSRLVEAAVKQLDKATDREPLVEFAHDTSDLETSHRAAGRVERLARTINGSTGAASGLGGLWTMGADIPATLGIAMRNVRDTGRAYGYDGHGEAERVFRLQILELAALDDADRRRDLIAQIESSIADDGSLKSTSEGTIEPLVDQAVERVSRALAFASVRTRFGMAVPLLGSVVGGIVNSSFQKDVSRAARFAYQARRLRAAGQGAVAEA